MSKYVVVVYKEVGKEPEFRKIENSIEEFEKLVGGEITTIHFEDIEIVYKKDSDNLRPNIYIRPDFLSIGLSIRGNLFVINKNDDGSFTTLNKEQAIKCREILIRTSFNYGRYIPCNKKNNTLKRNENQKFHDNFQDKENYTRKIKNEREKIGERTIDDTCNASIKEDTNTENFNAEEVLKMIVGIQSVILRFIQSISE
jgi:hypothetical protein